MNFSLKKLGPGLLFAGAAIGVSHLVQSTRAGADFGLGLLWALLLVNICKYPFFQFATRYASATGESLLDGYKKLGKGILWGYAIITLATMFTIQTAVTIVTAGLAKSLFGINLSIEIWSIIILCICITLIAIGKYSALDRIIKIIIITLTISTITAVIIALFKNNNPISFTQVVPKGITKITFLVAFMGWMPAPLDISVFQSLWTVEKLKNSPAHHQIKTALFDFNIGYIGTTVLGICFVLLGTLVMHNTSTTFSTKAGVFANQLIDMYSNSLGNWSKICIGITALTTMFSTTLTTLDASPRAMHRTTQLLFNKTLKNGFMSWVLILTIGTISIFFVFLSEMGTLIKIATVLSFITAPFFAIINYWLICSKHTPKQAQPKLGLHILSGLGILFLIGFSAWYLSII